MEVKKYQAESINEAIGKVKKVLGPEAMIISTRKVGAENNNDGFEITAVPAQDDTNYSSPLEEVRSELLSIKEMIYLINHTSGTEEMLMKNPSALNIYSKLIRSGVKDYYARIFLERAGVLAKSVSNDSNSIREKIIKEIMYSIKVKDIFDAGNKRHTVIALIGTTGVGKTTTIAKLAAQLMIKANKKVGLISIDNYRIGSTEQIKTYANILGIPCLSAFTRRDLIFSLKRMQEKDIVFIDTAGQSQYDRSRIGELKNIMTDDLGISSHLLLSVSTSESEMNKAAIHFSTLNFQSYIFTKTDEAGSSGSMINQIMKLKLPVSYITTGQNVPDDIERAHRNKIVNLLLNNN